MTTKHHITSADKSYIGAGFFGPIFHANERKGIPVDFLTRVDLGSPIAADTNALIAAATGTELPNAATKTYTPADAGASPVDDAGQPSVATIQPTTGGSASVFVLDVPRNITLAATHATSLVAMTVTVRGFDFWGQPLTETLSITATGTSKTAAGKKAFWTVKSIAVTSAGDATANTLSVGFGDVLGLPYRLTEKVDVLKIAFNDAADAGTVVAADASTATETTGDVRGTYDPAAACNGSKVVLWLHIQDRGTERGLRGVDQYAG